MFEAGFFHYFFQIGVALRNLTRSSKMLNLNLRNGAFYSYGGYGGLNGSGG